MSHLALEGCHSVGDPSLDALSSCRALVVLELAGTAVTVTGVQRIRRQCPSLAVLDLEGHVSLVEPPKHSAC